VAEKLKYNAYDAFAIKDDIRRNVYMHKTFDAGSIEDIDDRIVEYIELHNNGTFVESEDAYATTLVCLTCICGTNLKNELKNYNLLFNTALVVMYQMGTHEDAWNTLNGLEKKDFKLWIRKKKLVTLNDKIRND
jgi:hypothetical protein